MKRAQLEAPHRIPSRLTAIAAGCALAFAIPTFAQAANVEFVLSDESNGGQYLSAVTNLSADQPAALANAQFRIGATNASVQNGLVGSDVTGSNSGTVTVTGNTSQATSTLNTASNSLSGTGAQSITSTIDQAVISLSMPTLDLIGSQGSVTSTIDASQVVANQQVTRNAGSTAVVDQVTVRGRVDGDMASALTVDRNTLSAQLTGNTATNVFNQQGGAGQFTGSVAVTNQQANTAVLGGANSDEIVDEMRATVSNSPIRAEATGTLSSSMTLSANQQTATVQGNVAGARDASGRILAGNALIISGANAVTGSLDASTSGSTSADFSEVRELNGGLALGNMQRSQNTAYKANINDSEIEANALKADADKTITVRDNLQQASATGNLAGSLISVESNSIQTGAAASNRQRLENSKVESVIDYSSTIAETDTASETNNGRITVSGNRALASSTGNAGSLSTSLSANSIETKIDSRSSQYNAAPNLITSRVSDQDVRASSYLNDSNAVTVSGNEYTASALGNTVSTQVSLSGTSVLASVYDNTFQDNSGTNLDSSIGLTNIKIDSRSSAAALTVSDNQLNARTVGNAADTRTQIVGTQLGSAAQALTFAVLGNQFVGDDSSLSSGLSESSIGVLANNAAAGSTLTVSGNTMLASTTANTYQRALVLDGTSINAGASRLDTIQYSNAPIAAKVESSSIGINGLTSAVTASAVVSANTVLAIAAANQATTATAINATSLSTDDLTSYSEQEMRASMLAKAEAGQGIGINNAFAGGGNATVSNNITAAQATANSNTNQMVLNASSLTVGIAKVESQQRRAGSIEAIANAVGQSFAIVSVDAATDKVLGGSLTVQSNQMAAVAIGNTGVNTLQASAVSATGTFELSNTQNSEGTDITASTQPRLIGIDALTGDGTSANGVAMVVSGNSASASASANTATNRINLVASSALNAPATLQSRQLSEGLVSAVVGDTADPAVKTLVGVAPLNSLRGDDEKPITVSYGNVTVSDNRLVAQASANTVSNALNLASAGSVGSSGSWKAYALNSNQISTGEVKTTVNSAYVGVDAASVTAAPLTVSGNTVAAVSAANTASNALTASSLPGSPVFATLSVINNQSATNSVTSTVSAVTIGNTVGAGTPSGAMTVSGNTLVAQAGGNSAVNRIVGR